MMGKTHMAIGFLAGVLLFSVVDANPVVFVPLVVLGSLLPDVDHENSKINRLVPVTRWVPKFFKHRGFFHSVFPALILYTVSYATGTLVLGMPVVLGYLAHLFSDCFTRLGCNLLHPLSTLRVQGFLMTGGITEAVVLIVVWSANVVLVVKKLGI